MSGDAPQPAQRATSPTVRLDAQTEAESRDLPRGGRLLTLLLLCYYALKPLYIFDSGGPQPADAVILLLSVAVFSLSLAYSQRQSRLVSNAILAFCVYAAAVSIVWFTVFLDVKVLLPALFYVFNCLLFIVCLRVFEIVGANSLRHTGTIVIACTVAYALLSFLDSNVGGSRATLYFNNPNQLAYWALLSGCLITACDQAVKLRRELVMSGYLCAGYLCVLSLSKAAMISFAVLLLFAFTRRLSYAVVAAVLVMPPIVADVNLEFLDRARDRLEDIGQQDDDSAAGRGYNRIWEHPEHLIFGAGERHDTFGYDREMHSTLGTALFSYGIVGLALFIRILVRLVRAAGASAGFVLLPPMIYGLTHQGLRFSILWMLFAVVAYSGALRASERRQSGI